MAGGTANIGKLIIELLLKDKEFKGALKDAGNDVSKIMPKMQAVSKKAMKSIRRGLKLTSAAMVTLATATTVVGARFEHQMSAVAAVANVADKTGMSFRTLTENARELGATTAFTATQAAEGMEELARAGLTANEIVSASEPVLHMAGAGQVGLARSAKIVAASMAQFSLGAEDATHIADVYTVAIQNSLFSMNDLGEAMKFAGPAGAAFGKDITEVTAAVAQFRDLGMEGTLAGTQYRMMMAKAALPTKKARKALAKYGLTVQDINPQLNSFKDIMLATGEAGMTAADSFVIFDRRAGSAVAAISQKMAASTESYDDLAAKIKDSAGATERTYEAMMDNVIGQTQIFKSKVEEAMLTLFDQYYGPLTDLIRELSGLMVAVIDSFDMMETELSGGFASVINSIISLIKDNKEAAATAITDTILLLIELGKMLMTIAPALLIIAGAIAKVIPYVDDLAIAFATIWAIHKWATLISAIYAFTKGMTIASVASWGMAAGVNAVTAAGTALQTFLAMSSGGMTLVVVAIGAVVVGLVLLAKSYWDVADAAKALEKVQDELAVDADRLSKSREDAITWELVGFKKKIRLLKENKAEYDRLTDAQKKNLEAVLDMNDADAISAVKKGDLFFQNGRLLSTQLAISTGIGGIKKVKIEMARLDKEIAKDREKQRGANGKYQEQLQTQLDDNINAYRGLEQAVESLSVAETEETKKFRLEMQKKAEEQARIDTAANEKHKDDLEKMYADILKLEDGFRDAENKNTMSATELRREELYNQIEDIEETFSKGLKLLGDDEDAKAKLRARYAAARISATEAYEHDVKEIKKKEDEEEHKKKQKRFKAKYDEQQKLFALLESSLQKELTASEAMELEKQKTLTELAKLGANQRQLDEVEAAFDNRIAEIRTEAEERANSLIRLKRKKGLSKIAALQMKHADEMNDIEEASAATKDKLRKAQHKEMRRLRRQNVKETIKAAKETAKSVIGVVKKNVDRFTKLLKKIYDVDFTMQDAIQSIQSQEKAAEEEGTPFDVSKAAEQFIDELVSKSVRLFQIMAEAAPVLLRELASQLPILIQAGIDALPELFRAIADSIPKLIMVILKKLPELIDVLIEGLVTVILAVLDKLPEMITQLFGVVLPRLIMKLGEAIPQILEAVLAALPDILDAIIASIDPIIDALIFAIPRIVKSIVEVIPQIMTMLFEFIPEVVREITDRIPDIIGMIIGMIPDIIVALVSSLPDLLLAFYTMVPKIMWGIVAMLPELVARLWDELWFFFVFGIPKIANALWETVKGFVDKIWLAFVALITEGIPEIAAKIWEAITGFFGKVGELFKKPKNKKKNQPEAAFSGISYVPSTMRMTLHKGEAVIPADRNAAQSSGGPATAGAAQNGIMTQGGGGGNQSIEVVVMAEGRVLDAVQDDAMRLGRATKMKKAIKRISGVSIGLNRGKYTAW